MIYSVLFVCTANICRSPMAMGLLRGRVRDSSDVWRVESAGVWAEAGYPPSHFTEVVLAERKIAIPDHRSQPVSAELLSQFNLVLTMERNHKEALQAAFPALRSRVFLISELVGRQKDIADPIGLSLVDYEDTARELESILERGMERLRFLACDPQPSAANS